MMRQDATDDPPASLRSLVFDLTKSAEAPTTSVVLVWG
jgi:hypothetical protein